MGTFKKILNGGGGHPGAQTTAGDARAPPHPPP